MPIMPHIRVSLRTILRVAFAAGIVLLSGCAVIYDASGAREETGPSLVGLHISELPDVTQILFYRGYLLVALTDDFEKPYSHAGIAVVDTSADTVIAHVNPFGDQWQVPWSVATANDDSLLYAVSQYGSVRMADSWNHWSSISAAPPSAALNLLPTTDGVFLFGQQHTDIRKISGKNVSLRFRLSGTDFITGIVVSGEKLFVVRGQRRDVIVANASGAAIDSILLDSLTGLRGIRCTPEMVVAHRGRLFISMFASDTSGHLDTARIVVLDSATFAVDTILKLKYAYHFQGSEERGAPRVTNGTWYLPGFDTYASIRSGVETVDLEGATLPGEVLTAAAAGGSIHDFLPAGPGKAYVVLLPPNAGSFTLRRVSY